MGIASQAFWDEQFAQPRKSHATMNTPSPDPFRASPPLPNRQEVEQWMEQVWHEGTPVQISASDVHIAEEAAKWAFAIAHQYYASVKPVAWMYLGEPTFDGTQWRDHWQVTLDQRLAEWQTPTPIPLVRPLCHQFD